MTITEFLEARIAEDEAAARDRTQSAYIHTSGCYYYDYTLDAGWFCDCDEDGEGTARVLAECKAKRAIIDCLDNDWYGIPYVVRILAAVYADHPAYQEEWKL